MFHNAARAPAREADQELESLVYDISTRIAGNLQMSLEQIFNPKTAVEPPMNADERR